MVQPILALGPQRAVGQWQNSRVPSSYFAKPPLWVLPLITKLVTSISSRLSRLFMGNLRGVMVFCPGTSGSLYVRERRKQSGRGNLKTFFKDRGIHVLMPQASTDCASRLKRLRQLQAANGHGHISAWGAKHGGAMTKLIGAVISN